MYIHDIEDVEWNVVQFESLKSCTTSLELTEYDTKQSFATAEKQSVIQALL